MANELRKWRKESGLTVRQLSERSGISYESIKNMELGRTPFIGERFLAVARAMINVKTETTKARKELQPTSEFYDG